MPYASQTTGHGVRLELLAHISDRASVHDEKDVDRAGFILKHFVPDPDSYFAHFAIKIAKVLQKTPSCCRKTDFRRVLTSCKVCFHAWFPLKEISNPFCPGFSSPAHGVPDIALELSPDGIGDFYRLRVDA